MHVHHYTMMKNHTENCPLACDYHQVVMMLKLKLGMM